MPSASERHALVPALVEVKPQKRQAHELKCTKINVCEANLVLLGLHLLIDVGKPIFIVLLCETT